MMVNHLLSKGGYFFGGRKRGGIGYTQISTMSRKDFVNDSSRSVQFKSPKVGWGGVVTLLPESTWKIIPVDVSG